MREVLKQAVLLAVCAVLSWWLFLRVPPDPAIPKSIPVAPLALEVTPFVMERVPVEAAPPPTAAPVEHAPEPAPEEEPPPESSPPIAFPPELGAPEGEEPAGHAAAPAEVAREEVIRAEELPPMPEEVTEEVPEDVPAEVPAVAQEEPSPPEEPPTSAASLASPPPAPSTVASPPRQETQPEAASRAAVQTLMRDPGLLAEARAEFERGHSKGFATVLLAAPEDQIAIARFFGEELVLVPSRVLGPESADPRYFRMTLAGEPRVESVEGAPPLERFRQYRDLFDYEYGRLPGPLRELRRSVLARGEIYLFAALLSAEEWALVIARRNEALERAGRELSDVRRFVLRYVHRPENGYDLAVDEIGFADGTRFRPSERGKEENP
jgi:hypothetical protein